MVQFGKKTWTPILLLQYPGSFIYLFPEQGRFIDTRRSIQGGWLAICTPGMLFTTSMDDVYLVSIILCVKRLWAVW